MCGCIAVAPLGIMIRAVDLSMNINMDEAIDSASAMSGLGNTQGKAVSC